MEFPAYVKMLSGAILLLDNTSQMDALPMETAFEPTGEQDADGRHIYRAVVRQDTVQLKMLSAELKAATAALDRAASLLKEHGGGIRANEIKQAATRAQDALKDLALA